MNTTQKKIAEIIIGVTQEELKVLADASFVFSKNLDEYLLESALANARMDLAVETDVEAQCVKECTCDD